MFFEWILFVVIVLALLGLVRSTESLLDLRQQQRDRGNDTKAYL